MYQIKFYQAGTGDAASISYMGNDGKTHRIFIDSGYANTYKDVLKAEITALSAKQEVIDLWVITHTDDDHINGALTYCNEINAGKIPNIVKNYWYNPPKREKSTPDVLAINTPLNFSEISIGQGNDLEDYLQNYALQRIVNTQLPYDFFGLRLTILSPSLKKLAKIQDNIIKEETVASNSIAIAAKDYDYNKPIAAFDPNVFEKDTAPSNGSSIAFIMEYEKLRMLWTADAHLSVLEAKLRALGYSETNRLRCDWVKVVHHGSAANNSLSLYRLLDCSNYLVSADAAVKHKLPNKAALVRIINAQAPNTCHFAFTHDNAKLRSIFAIDKDANIKCSFPEKGAKWFVIKG